MVSDKMNEVRSLATFEIGMLLRSPSSSALFDRIEAACSKRPFEMASGAFARAERDVLGLLEYSLMGATPQDTMSAFAALRLPNG